MSEEWSEDMIGAYLDGSIDDPDERARIAHIIETDPTAGALAERISRTNALLRAAFDAPMNEPVPPAIAATLRQGAPAAKTQGTGLAGLLGRVLRVRSVLEHALSPGAVRPIAITAGLALTIGILGGVFGERFSVDQGETTAVALGVQADQEAFSVALETLPSGATDETGRVRLLLSFLDGSGRPCREFETTANAAQPASLGIACRTDDNRWTVEVIAASVAQDGALPAAEEGARPAASVAEDVLGATLDAMEAGPALTAEAEADLIARGWSINR